MELAFICNVDKWEIPTCIENNGEKVLPDIASSIQSKLNEKQIAADQVEGIGIGVPGPVSSDSTVNKCINLGWGVFNLKERRQTECQQHTGQYRRKISNGAPYRCPGKSTP